MQEDQINIIIIKEERKSLSLTIIKKEEVSQIQPQDSLKMKQYKNNMKITAKIQILITIYLKHNIT